VGFRNLWREIFLGWYFDFHFRVSTVAGRQVWAHGTAGGLFAVAFRAVYCRPLNDRMPTLIYERLCGLSPMQQWRKVAPIDQAHTYRPCQRNPQPWKSGGTQASGSLG